MACDSTSGLVLCLTEFTWGTGSTSPTLTYTVTLPAGKSLVTVAATVGAFTEAVADGTTMVLNQIVGGTTSPVSTATVADATTLPISLGNTASLESDAGTVSYAFSVEVTGAVPDGAAGYIFVSPTSITIE